MSTEAKKDSGQVVEDVLYNDGFTFLNSRFKAPINSKILSDQLNELQEEIKRLDAKVTRLEKENGTLNDDLDNLLRNNEPDNDAVASVSSDIVDVEPKVKPKVETKKEPKKKTSNSKTYEATFYTAFCPTGCTGVTATGLDVSNSIYTPEGLRVVAVDPSNIPLGTIVQVTYDDGTSFKAKAADTGGDIKGNRIDILVESRDEAYRLGRKKVNVEVLK